MPPRKKVVRRKKAALSSRGLTAAETVNDVRTIQVPSTFTGRLRIEIGMYDGQTQQRRAEATEGRTDPGRN